VCYRCGKSGHFIVKCPYTSDSDRDDDKKGKKKIEKKRYYKKKGGEAHMGLEWDSDESSTESSSDEDAVNISINKGLLFLNVGRKCLMAKDGKKKKVHSRDTPKYTTSYDEGSSSDDNDDLTSLFANLIKDQKKKINELIESINEKDDLLECQEHFLVKKNKKFVKLKNAYALEVEKCENLSRELSMCNDSISCLRIENDNLIAKIEELNVCKPSTSTVEHVTICTRCRDVNIDAMNDHIAMIKDQNDHIDKLNAKIAEHELENENFKFARSMLYNGRCPGIKDGLTSNKGAKATSSLMPQITNSLILLRVRLPWFRIERVTFYILRTILTIKLGKFILENLILFLIMLICIVMRYLALGIQLISKCLKIKLLMHQMSITFHLRLLMHLMC
jgi:hypothetical protein